MINILEEKYGIEKFDEKRRHLAYLTEQVQVKNKELQKWNEAYAAGYLDLTEWGEKKLVLRQEIEKIDAAIAKKEAELAQQGELERQKQWVLSELEAIRNKDFGEEGNIPFDTKRKIVALLVEDIVVSSKDRVFKLDGVIQATRSYGQDFESGSTL